MCGSGGAVKQLMSAAVSGVVAGVCFSIVSRLFDAPLTVSSCALIGESRRSLPRHYLSLSGVTTSVSTRSEVV